MYRLSTTRLLLLAACLPQTLAIHRSPSILFILADDLGFNEMGFMNATRGLHTPNLDALANNGIVFKNYYAQPICSPSRSALMTGRYPIRLGSQASVIYWDTPWGIPLENRFLPQFLQSQGYHTALFGKWHLGMFKEEYAPWMRGFDEHAGYLQGCGSAWTHVAACCAAGSPASDQDYVCPSGSWGSKDYRGYDWFSHGGKPDFSANGTNSVDLIRKAAVDYLERAGKSEKPFFLYLPFQNVHAPYTTEEKFREIYSKDRFSENEMTMFGYISEMDSAVGDVMQALRASGRYDETVIIFNSDNGAPDAAGVRGRNWPYQGFKTQIWEGGVRVPAFVHSPLLPAHVRGTVSHELYHVTDWLPTIVGLAKGQPLLSNYTLDGFNIWPSLTAGTVSPRKEILYNVNPLCTAGQAAAPKAGIRIGRWKLLSYCYSIAGVAGGNHTGPITPTNGLPSSWPSRDHSPVVLFDLSADEAEDTDVASEHPEVVKQLLERLEQLAAESVEPMQWEPPFQGEDYFCAKCPLRPSSGPGEPWTPWIHDAEVVLM